MLFFVIYYILESKIIITQHLSNPIEKGAIEMDQGTYGMITEQGDLGLGFEPISESDQAKVEQAQEENKDEK